MSNSCASMSSSNALCLSGLSLVIVAIGPSIARCTVPAMTDSPTAKSLPSARSAPLHLLDEAHEQRGELGTILRRPGVEHGGDVVLGGALEPLTGRAALGRGLEPRHSTI